MDYSLLTLVQNKFCEENGVWWFGWGEFKRRISFATWENWCLFFFFQNSQQVLGEYKLTETKYNWCYHVKRWRFNKWFVDLKNSSSGSDPSLYFLIARSSVQQCQILGFSTDLTPCRIYANVAFMVLTGHGELGLCNPSYLNGAPKNSS